MPKPNDPVTTAQVADLLRQAELTDDALALYKKAAELAPDQPPVSRVSRRIPP